MKPFEYLLVFVVVILGLAVTDLAMSLHRLFSAGKRVRWDWLAPLAAALSLIVIVVHWWSWYRADSLVSGFTFDMYLLVVMVAVLQFLMAATALPDESHEAVIDLRRHFEQVRPRFWIFFTLHWVLLQIVSLWSQMSILHASFNGVSPLWLIVPLGASLAVIRNRAWQFIGLAGLLALYLSVYSGHTLTQ